MVQLIYADVIQLRCIWTILLELKLIWIRGFEMYHDLILIKQLWQVFFISVKLIKISIGFRLGLRICNRVWYLVNSNIYCLFIYGKCKPGNIWVNVSTHICSWTSAWIYRDTIFVITTNLTLGIHNGQCLDINGNNMISEFYKCQINKSWCWIHTWYMFRN